MTARGLAVHVVLATLLLAGAADASSRGPSASTGERRDLDVVASAQPSDPRRGGAAPRGPPRGGGGGGRGGGPAPPRPERVT